MWRVHRHQTVLPQRVTIKYENGAEVQVDFEGSPPIYSVQDVETGRYWNGLHGVLLSSEGVKQYYESIETAVRMCAIANQEDARVPHVNVSEEVDAV